LAVNPEFALLPWLKFHQGDITVPESLPRKQKFSHVLHAAADSTNGAALSAIERYDQIINGTRNLLDFAVSVGATRFLLTSSGAVYGRQPASIDRIPETYMGMPDPMQPNNAYGVAKRGAEHLCALYAAHYGIETVVARCFAFVGQDLPLNVHFAIGNFIRDALWADRITVNGDGTPLRSYLDQRDLARWLMALLITGRKCEAYNVGSEEALSIRQIATLVRDLLAPGKEVHVMQSVGADNGRNLYVPDVAKARNELDLYIDYSLRSSVLDVADVVRKATGTPV
jgi:UDP-glucuronate decarboxylase